MCPGDNTFVTAVRAVSLIIQFSIALPMKRNSVERKKSWHLFLRKQDDSAGGRD